MWIHHTLVGTELPDLVGQARWVLYNSGPCYLLREGYDDRRHLRKDTAC